MLVGTPFLQDLQDDHTSPEIQACAPAEYRTEEYDLELNLRQGGKKLGKSLGKWDWEIETES